MKKHVANPSVLTRGTVRGRWLVATVAILLAGTSSNASADGYNLNNTGYTIDLDPDRCNCKANDPNIAVFIVELVDSVTFSGIYAANGYCGATYTKSGGEALKSLAIPSGSV